MLLILSWTVSLSQGIASNKPGIAPVTLTRTFNIDTYIKRRVANDLAELDMRRVDAKADSVSISDLTLAYTNTRESLRKCEEAMSLSSGLLTNKEVELEQTKGLLKTSRMQVKTQKFLKWVFIGIATAVTIKSIN